MAERARRMPLLLLLLVLLPATACRPVAREDATAATPPPPPLPPSPPTDAAKLTVCGTAANAKAGAVIETDDRGVVYVARLDAWPRAAQGKRVRATGTLRIVHHGNPCPRPGDDCAAGLSGDQRLLDDAVVTDEAGRPLSVH